MNASGWKYFKSRPVSTLFSGSLHVEVSVIELLNLSISSLEVERGSGIFHAATLTRQRTWTCAGLWVF